MKKWVWPTLLIAFLGASVVAQNWIDAPGRVPPQFKETLYLNSGEALKRASVGFDGLMADIYWIRVLLYFGGHLERQRATNQAFNVRQLDLLEPMLNLTVELDPRYLAAYRFGAVFLPDINAENAVRFVELGIRNNPGEWRLYQDLGFVQWRQGHFREAAEAYARGADLPGAPAWMRPMAALMVARGGDLETAKEMFLRLYEESDDPFIKQICEEQLELLDQNRER
jgi:hypothetical protein